MLPGTSINFTTAYRVEGASITPANWAKRVLVGQALDGATTIVDTKPLSNKTATYVVYVTFKDSATPPKATVSGISNPATILY